MTSVCRDDVILTQVCLLSALIRKRPSSSCTTRAQPAWATTSWINGSSLSLSHSFSSSEMRWEVSDQRLLSHQLMGNSYTWSGLTTRTVWNRCVFVCLCFQPTDFTRWFPNLSSSWICSPTGMCGRTAGGWRWATYESCTVKNIRPISQNLSEISWACVRFLY